MRTDQPILLVEDDDRDVLTVRGALHGLKVPNPLVVAADGEEGLAILRAGRVVPAIILLDLNMPRMGGVEFLRRVRAENLVPGVPVVVLTTSRRDREVLEGFALGVAAYLVKPLDYVKLVEAVDLIPAAGAQRAAVAFPEPSPDEVGSTAAAAPSHSAATAPMLPPGQTTTTKFPVVGESEPAPAALDLQAWRLIVDGLVENPLELDYEEVSRLPSRELVADIHCVTGWTRRASRFAGLPLAELLDRVRPLAHARFVRFVAYSPRDHDTTLPLDVARADTWLIHSFDGAPLTLEHGYPLRTVTPSRYFYKSLKWLRRVELLADDRLGYWERESSYHNVGDPTTGEQRFASGSLAPERVEAFRRARDFRAWRGPRKVLLGLDLRHWKPSNRDLRGLQLKNCDLRGAELAAVDLREANLSLCDLRGADLRGTDLRGADVEGADFRGANLEGADLSAASCTASRFAGEHEGRETLVAGLSWRLATGLLESQVDFLMRHSPDSSR